MVIIPLNLLSKLEYKFPGGWGEKKTQDTNLKVSNPKYSESFIIWNENMCISE